MTMKRQVWQARFLDRKGHLVQRHEIELADAPTLEDAAFQVSCLTFDGRAAKLEIQLGDASPGKRGSLPPGATGVRSHPAEEKTNV